MTFSILLTFQPCFIKKDTNLASISWTKTGWFSRVIEIQKITVKHKFVNKYSATNRAHLYCQWARFVILISSCHLNLVQHCSTETFINLFFLREYTCEIYRFQPGMALIIDYMIIFNLFIWKENFTVACSNRGEVLTWATLIQFLNMIVILFLYCCCLTC